MSLTDDPNDPRLDEIDPESGIQKAYLVLSDEERRKGFVRPLRRSYTHLACGSSTRMALALCETYAREPSFYGGTYCGHCGTHFPLRDASDRAKSKGPDYYAFVWDEDGEGVGS